MSPKILISKSAVAAVVSDPRLPDNPIVACNEAFIWLTGFEHAEVIGRNCRFLRGEKTEPQKTELLRQAIQERRPAMVELVNYRKDGSKFRNAVMIAPLFDDDGSLQYFLGSQIAIDDGQEIRRQKARSKIGSLSNRQRQIIEFLVKGQLNKQIAHELGLTERTIKMHRAALLKSLDVRTVAEAIRIAVEAGL
ncbi:PAS domain-containing protein [Porphyrobacter algicida]|uniref:PAS domain-containing protein n=1 Tax=Qipengyuania algicida TaxID=1836209 RepID=A0A845AJ47_9SPHN|nr:PAS domain-containing protein [Qipengyuania algicida]MXP29437.1 PAS domain-containing protein [Qipengyuania algicida]